MKDAHEVLSHARSRILDHAIAPESFENHAEVHTPFSVINRMLDKLQTPGIWSDPDKTWLDPCSGIGNFPLVIAERLMEGLTQISDPNERYRHIFENQIYMVEIQPRNAILIERLFNPDGDIALNLKCCDALALGYLSMEPEDWKTERFRTDYGLHNAFFTRETPQEEIEKLQRTLRLLEGQPDTLRQPFTRGYDESILDECVVA